MKFIEQLRRIWKSPDMRRDLLFILGMLTLFRLVAHIPLPGVDVRSLQALLGGNQFLGLLNVFTGGTISNFSVVALGVGPYITASIIIQLLTMVLPKLEELQKEGEQGQARINAYTRYLTVPLCFLQGYGIIALLRQSGQGVVLNLSPMTLATMLFTMAAGTLFLMWIGELISEKKMGNGISLLIFAGIVAALPQYLAQTAAIFDAGQAITLLAFAVVAAVTIAGVVTVSEGQRNIPVTYAKRVHGMQLAGGVDTHLPLRVSMAGVIPIIFAISVMLFPPIVAQLFLRAKTVWLAAVAEWTVRLFQNQLFYSLAYFLLVFGFTFFYTTLIFRPTQIAENLQKQGGFIPGIRPGSPTANYLTFVMNRITLAGAVFLAVIAVLPLAMQQYTGSQTMAIGGTSLLIVVSVVIETVKQIQSQLTMREYETI
ncbi:preprotein translocase subunit SecY [Patescibacteria group bacterium]|nr:MAG: preprotein translocase subunit SecY [Patescibacteria group bacterium]